jgi:rSAM/selenodomain-associated transferase 1
MRLQLLVIAKEPVPGRVKTRLCPPCTPQQAAAVAAASLADTLRTVDASPVALRTLAICGNYRPPAGWGLVRQRGDGLGQRLAHAFADTAVPGLSTLLIGMDTPQVGPAQLAALADGLDRVDAVLGPAEDGGWWALALRDPAAARVLAGVPMSTPDTCTLTRHALDAYGLTVEYGPSLRDVDTAADAHAVAAACPGGSFAATVRMQVPTVAERVAR